MEKGLLKVNWNDISKLTDEEISYFLYVEGKSVEAIARIRSINIDTVKKHIVDGKIKYRYIVKSNDISSFFRTIIKAGKDDKVYVLSSIDSSTRNKLSKYIKNNFMNMSLKEKESALWLIGEMKSADCLDILVKSSVNKYVGIRRMAVSAVGKIGDKSCEGVLLRALEDDNPQVIQYAINALIRIKSAKAKEKIEAISKNTEKEYLKNAAAKYVEEFKNF